MPNNRWLFWFRKSTRPKLTHKVTGNLDITSFITGKSKYWVDHSSREKVNKVLILNDWTIDNWFNEDIEAAKKYFKKLLDDGFTLYGVINNKLVKITRSNLYEFDNNDTRKLFTPLSESKILEIAAENGIARNSIGILDHHKLVELIGDSFREVTGSKEIKSSLIAHSSFSYDDIMASYGHAKPSVISKSWYRNTARREQPFLAKQNFSRSYEEVRLRANSMLGFSEIDSRFLTNLKHLNCSLGMGEFNVEQNLLLQRILAKPSVVNIEKFSLVSSRISIQILLSQLRELSLTRSVLDINSLLGRNHNLEVLRLDKMTTEDNGNIILPEDLRLLKKLFISDSKFDSGNIERTLLSAKDLEELTISRIENLRFSTRQLRLPKLRTLTSRNIHRDSLETLLNASPNIEELTLASNGAKLGIVLRNRFLKLKSVNLRKIDAGTARAILNASPNIEYIKVEDCSNMPSDTTLVNLRKIDVTRLYSDQARQISHFAPNLEKLSITDGLGSLRGVTFQELKSITLKYIQPKYNIAETLCHLNAPKLETLTIQSGKGTFAPASKTLFIRHLSLYGPDSEFLTSIAKGNIQYQQLSIENGRGVFAPDQAAHFGNLSLISPDMEFLTSFLDANVTYNQLSIDIHYIYEEEYLQNGDLCEKLLNLQRQNNVSFGKVMQGVLDRYCTQKQQQYYDQPVQQDQGFVQLENIDVEQEQYYEPERKQFDRAEHLEYSAAQRVGKVDSNTVHDSVTFGINKYFTALNGNREIRSSLYRELIYTNVRKNLDDDGGSAPFILNTPPIEDSLVDTDMNYCNKLFSREQQNSSQYQARVDMVAGRQWMPLPSISSMDEITHMFISQNGEDVSDQVIIKYSRETNLYYIKSKSNMKIPIALNYLLNADTQHTLETTHTLPAEMLEIIQRYKNFRVDQSRKIEVPKNADAAIQYMESNRVGACRHRTPLCMLALKERYPDLKMRAVNNQCHSYLEIFHKGKWVSCNLGGYPGKLNEHKVSDDKKITVTNVKLVYSDEAQQIDRAELEIALGQKLHSDSDISSSEELLQNQREVEHKLKELELEINPDQEPGIFRVWESDVSSAKNLSQHLMRVINQPLADNTVSGNILVDVSSKDIESYNSKLQTVGKNLSKNIFYVNSPEDLKCSSNYLYKNGTKIEIHKGPGGPLVEFLKEHKNNNPIILINYNNFTHDEIVNFNSLIDDTREVDGYSLPSETRIIGVYDRQDLDAYTGSDFYSRFHRTVQCPTVEPFEDKDALEAHLHSPINRDIEITENLIEVELFDSGEWKSLLIGKLNVQGGSMQFSEGPLLKALKENKPLLVKNAPWHLEEFRVYLQQALLRGEINVYGEKIKIPSNFRILSDTGYDWKLLKAATINENAVLGNIHHAPIVMDKQFFASCVIVNSDSFGSLLQSYKLKEPLEPVDDEYKDFYQTPGILEEISKTDEEINLFITETIPHRQWAELLSEAQKLGVKLNIKFAKDVEAPDELFTEEEIQNRRSVLPGSRQANLILTSDIDCSVLDIKDHLQNVSIVDISECGVNEILVDLKPKLDEETNAIKLLELQSDILKRLCKGENIVLKGHFSQEMINTLAPFFSLNKPIRIQGRILEDVDITGSLFLVTDDSSDFSYLPTLAKRTWSLDEKLARLQTNREALPFRVSEDTSLAELKVIVGNANPENDPWYGLYNIVSPELIDSDEIDISDNKFEEFSAQRINKFYSALEQGPYVFLSGNTGVGKTSFLTQEVRGDCSLHFDEHNFTNWINDQTYGTKILVIDEANIGKGDFSRYEGLFDDPPRIYNHGKWHNLTPEHKVVFLGNPASYGDRNVPTLFARHDNCVLFDQMSPAYIFKKILAPALHKFEDEDKQYIAKKILRVSNKIKALANDPNAISARELQMIALLINSEVGRDEITDNKIAYYINMVTNGLAPEEKEVIFTQWFTGVVGDPNNHQLQAPEIGGNKDFVFTRSRLPMYHRLNTFLKLRSDRKTSKNPAVQYGGINGLLFEGEPGTGKTQAVMSVLLNNGLKYGQDFVRLSITMGYAEKIDLLNDAFKNGKIVIIDEINSCPMLERELNSFLMGYDLDGERPDKPGFMIIGTQNPISMSGRYGASQALERRFVKEIIPRYQKDELITILTEMYPEEDELKIVNTVIKYLHAIQYAEKRKLSPSPKFRDLLNYAKKSFKHSVVRAHLLHSDPVRIPSSQSFIESQRQHVENNELQQQRVNIVKALNAYRHINFTSVYTRTRHKAGWGGRLKYVLKKWPFKHSGRQKHIEHAECVNIALMNFLNDEGRNPLLLKKLKTALVDAKKIVDKGKFFKLGKSRLGEMLTEINETIKHIECSEKVEQISFKKYNL